MDSVLIVIFDVMAWFIVMNASMKSPKMNDPAMNASARMLSVMRSSLASFSALS